MFANYKAQFAKDLEDIKTAGMWKEVKTIAGKQGTEVEMVLRQAQDGQVQTEKVLNFCSNNYLGLAGSEEMASAAKEGINKYGFGMASVRFICGVDTVHKELEEAISKFFGAGDTILYTSCFDANTGLFETILQEGDAIFSDELNHASIIDGVRLCKAERFRYLHSNMEDLEAKLKEAGERRRKLIATDGVFSMDGDTAKLREICDLAEKYDAMVMVDDSHASGVLGTTGRGSVEGMMDRIDILTSTFGKALGGAGGGWTCGRKEIIEVLRQRSRTSLFSNSLPPMIAAAALFTLQNYDDLFRERLEVLRKNTAYFRAAMEKLGFKLGGDGKHPITPVMLMEEKLATEMAGKLFGEGMYVRGFTYPVVPKGKARIRVQLSSAHTQEQLDKAIAAFEKIGRELSVIK
ncbi:MAG: glycine C-acetyltransferase [Candidatus Doudnabacteria bacterium RIFCSPLOWO2_01_FULL_48_57]|uniref:Glycine C-acetyltransferase n=1 Tax=Candidatus Doudnabacteria bacterium RIFCSPLOWO2_02_FULL_48_13 TaxID=1817845 RepID=A0A1F5Q8S2_9BACT|nr:MAG: glycine C-acetyltransferase [Candidatus Doudnabacteria bacterium RIFCSPHIGHO2_01_48_18]OGE77055.1 MAG: glycine C-acetyltransferase [Candidatus Doudnabacteria bacterium RIFCSPHIGHO2_01_FULL_48_180]OGE90983.1 MAG: glycine C-acetyltransferase [Candidatus Doudnabacteria bacterium RIFCSPHIGHO2_12_FULL_47_25]OGE96345.1 MAG: glycine C-acetyltransferase [Candidatus Doudnabacteria bacterium RIFCSPLOWO2_01_FULL_48_57]OGE98584.1 MAG: glycine C-acetyltransferase [Candidatus Doudnabacteria bacterium